MSVDPVEKKCFSMSKQESLPFVTVEERLFGKKLNIQNIDWIILLPLRPQKRMGKI